MRKQNKTTRKQQGAAKTKSRRPKQLGGRSTKGKGAYKFNVNANWPSLGLNGSLSGSGPYRAATSSSSAVTVAQVPSMHSSGDGFVVRHREYLGELLSSTIFANNSFRINPGDANVFPWLAPIAQKFEEYKFNGLAFEFRSTSASALNSVNTALGVVVAAVEYNVVNAAFNNKLQMENSMWAVSCKPSESLIMPVECDSRINPLGVMYVRSGQPVNDPRFYDLGLMQFATIGQQLAGVDLGELWISYDVTLYKPIIAPSLVQQSGSNHYRGNAAVALIPYNQIVAAANQLPNVTCDGVATVSFAPHTPGRFSLNYTLHGTIATGAIGVWSPNVFGGIAYLNVLRGATLSGIPVMSTTDYEWVLYIDVPDVPNVCTMTLADTATFPTGVVTWDLVITALSSTFF